MDPQTLSSARRQLQLMSQTVRALVEALEAAAYDISEMGCTCPSGAQIHARDCVGNRTAAKYEAIAKRVRRRTSTQEPKSRRKGTV